MKLLKFYAPWWGQCKVLTKELEKNPISIPVESINVEEDDEELIEDTLKRAAFKEGVRWFKENLWHDLLETPEELGHIIFDRGIYDPHSYYIDNLQEFKEITPNHALKWVYYDNIFYSYKKK